MRVWSSIDGVSVFTRLQSPAKASSISVMLFCLRTLGEANVSTRNDWYRVPLQFEAQSGVSKVQFLFSSFALVTSFKTFHIFAFRSSNPKVFTMKIYPVRFTTEPILRQYTIFNPTCLILSTYIPCSCPALEGQLAVWVDVRKHWK